MTTETVDRPQGHQAGSGRAWLALPIPARPVPALGADDSFLFGTRYFSRTCLRLIYEFADRPEIGLPFDLLVCVGEGESGLNMWEHTGDGGLSFGVFQLYTVAHGHDEAYWTGPSGLSNSMAEMAGRWRDQFVVTGGWGRWAGGDVDRIGHLRDFWHQGQGTRDLPTDGQLREAEGIGTAVSLYYLDRIRQGSSDEADALRDRIRRIAAIVSEAPLVMRDGA